MADLSCKIFVGGLDDNTDKNSLEAYFSRFGEIIDSVVMMRDNRSRRFGFVTFTDSAPADTCVKQDGGKHEIDGKMAECRSATEKGTKPREGSGGFRGRGRGGGGGGYQRNDYGGGSRGGYGGGGGYDNYNTYGGGGGYGGGQSYGGGYGGSSGGYGAGYGNESAGYSGTSAGYGGGSDYSGYGQSNFSSDYDNSGYAPQSYGSGGSSWQGSTSRYQPY